MFGSLLLQGQEDRGMLEMILRFENRRVDHLAIRLTIQQFPVIGYRGLRRFMPKGCVTDLAVEEKDALIQRPVGQHGIQLRDETLHLVAEVSRFVRVIPGITLRVGEEDKPQAIVENQQA